jgi:hypothetical protein
MPDVVDCVDTGRPWPFTVGVELVPFDPCARIRVTIDPDAGGLSGEEADTLAVMLGEARDLARSYQPGEANHLE